jgi:K+/H+ antiporter YhaU regulatory subunit KhtT
MNKNELTGRLKAIIERNSEFTTWTVSTPHLLMLVEEAVKEEREACAKVLDEMADYMESEMEPSESVAWVRSKAAAIRARGQA